MTILTQSLKSLLSYLATGQCYSGQQLGDYLGVSRSAVWKMINKLQKFGVGISRSPQWGYRMINGYQPLDEEAILKAINAKQRSAIQSLFIEPIVDSTNNYLLNLSESFLGNVCLAEYQTAGRGRRNREWQSAFGKNILMSLSWIFEKGPTAIVGLSMVVAIAILRALHEYGVQNIHLKWPNDILWNDAKLSGVLIDTRIDSVGICYVVIGIGINVERTTESATFQSMDIASILNKQPDRNKLVGLLLNHLLQIIPEFAIIGFSPYRDEWLSYDCLINKIVSISGLQQEIQGKVMGVDEQGGIILQQNNNFSVFHTGEISVRKK